jgi:hypothetical protein
MNVSWGLSFAQGGVWATQDSFRSHPFFGARGTGSLQGYNRLYDAVVREPDTRAMLLRRLRTILDRWWQPPGTPWPQRTLEQHLASLTNQIAPEAALDRQRWGNSWNMPNGLGAGQALPWGMRQLEEQFIEPRRRHFYLTHSLENTNRPIGITSRYNAGIPGPQPAGPVLRWGKPALSAAHPALDHLTLTNLSLEAIDLSGWTAQGPITFTFPSGTVLPPHGELGLASDLAALRTHLARAGVRGRFLLGNYRGHLALEPPVSLQDEHHRVVAVGAGENGTGAAGAVPTPVAR